MGERCSSSFSYGIIENRGYIANSTVPCSKTGSKIHQLKSPISNSEWEMHQSIKDVSTKEYPETLWVVAKPENAKTYLKSTADY